MTSQASLKARQGVRYLPLEHLKVLDPDTLKPVPADGKTIGEVMFQGNIVMKGYLKNKTANEKAFAGGWSQGVYGGIWVRLNMPKQLRMLSKKILMGNDRGLISEKSVVIPSVSLQS